MIGPEVGQFRIVRKLGKGGMGEVFQARDTKLDRDVALKFLSEELSHDPTFCERFLREAQAIAALNHPHICTIFETGEQESRPFFAMEYLEGKTLKQLAAEGPLEIGLLTKVALQLADALHAAHSKKILHRDLKPANVIFGEQSGVKLFDFGLAKPIRLAGYELDQTVDLRAQTILSAVPEGADASRQGELTRTGSTAGTLAYMSPEQLRNEGLDQRSDLFAFGLVLYEMATGVPAFRGSSIAQLIDSVLNRDPEAPSTLRPDLPAALDSVIRRLMQKDRADRFGSAAETREALMLSSRQPAAAGSAATTTPFLTTLGRRRSPLWLVSLIVGACFLGAWIGAAAHRWVSSSEDVPWRGALPALACFGLSWFIWWRSGRRLRVEMREGPVRLTRLEEEPTNRLWIGMYVVVWALALGLTAVLIKDGWRIWSQDESRPETFGIVTTALFAVLFWFLVAKGRRWRDHSPSRRWREIEVHGSYAQILGNISLLIADLEARVTGLNLEEGLVRATTSANIRTWGERMTFTITEGRPGVFTVRIESECVLPFEVVELGKNAANLRKAVEQLAR
jgi:tRNA A-37 threonylcarbamoyl transferase component Bud32